MSCWKQSLSNQFLFMKTWQSKVCISRIGSRENDSIFDAKARLLLLDFDYNVMVITWCHHSWFPASSIFDLANLKRYHVVPKDLDILHNCSVHAHLILIGSFGDETKNLASTIPNERAHVCFSTLLGFYAEVPVLVDVNTTDLRICRVLSWWASVKKACESKKWGQQ